MASEALRGFSHVDRHGRVIIPVEIRRELNLKPGERLSLVVKDGEIRMQTLDEAIRRLQEYVRSLPSGKASLVDELIAERRREAEQD